MAQSASNPSRRSGEAYFIWTSRSPSPQPSPLGRGSPMSNGRGHRWLPLPKGEGWGEGEGTVRTCKPMTLFTNALAISILLSVPLIASATSPRIASITPTGAQRGTEIELRFNGSRLDDAQEIVFYEPGIQVLKMDSAKTNVVKAQIKIAADCPLGEHHLRIRT